MEPSLAFPALDVSRDCLEQGMWRGGRAPPSVGVVGASSRELLAEVRSLVVELAPGDEDTGSRTPPGEYLALVEVVPPQGCFAVNPA